MYRLPITGQRAFPAPLCPQRALAICTRLLAQQGMLCGIWIECSTPKEVSRTPLRQRMQGDLGLRKFSQRIPWVRPGNEDIDWRRKRILRGDTEDYARIPHSHNATRRRPGWPPGLSPDRKESGVAWRRILNGFAQFRDRFAVQRKRLLSFKDREVALVLPASVCGP